MRKLSDIFLSITRQGRVIRFDGYAVRKNIVAAQWTQALHSEGLQT